MTETKYLVMATAGAEDDIICYPQVACSGLDAAREACNSELRAGRNAYIVDGQGRCQDASGCCANPRWPFPKYMRERIAALCT